MSLINISLEGTIYFAGRRTDDDEKIIQLFCKKFAGIPHESCFDALYCGTSFEWRQQDDVVIPFGDRRDCLISAVWIVDLDNDILQLRKKDQNRRISLRRLREGLPTSVADLEPYEPTPLTRHLIDQRFPKPTWNPKSDATARQMAYTSRILEDFSHQWRHILRSRYNRHTFQRLAYAIVRIVTMNFRVVEETSCRGATYSKPVDLTDLPSWKAPQNRIFRLGRVNVVLCQHPEHLMPTIQEDLGPRVTRHRSHPTPGRMESITYLVLTVREVFLYKASITDHGPSVYTKPESLLDGIYNPSSRAIEYLLMAAPACSKSYLHSLPLEVQDLMLNRLSMGGIEAARVGCILNLGSDFSWKTGDHTIERQDVFGTRSIVTPVESQIWFDDSFSGLVYK